MKKLTLLLLLFAGLAHAEELPMIPGYDAIQWGMAARDVHEALPNDTLTGSKYYYTIPFAGFPPESHPVEAGFFYQGGLQYVEFAPMYAYPEPEDWQGDFEQLDEYMRGVYGKPYDVSDNISTWVTTETVGRVFHLPGVSWTVRFDTREHE